MTAPEAKPGELHVRVGGPWFEDLEVGDRFPDAPALTLRSGHAALHQAIVGDRLQLPLDDTLADRVVGATPLAHPALVWDVAIGQSTVVTQRVIANLFYRGLVLHRHPLIGDTLRTTTEVIALKQNASRTAGTATGLAALRIRTVDQHERLVLDFVRCAMLPLRDGAAQTGRCDDLSALPADLDATLLRRAIAGWNLEHLRPCAPLRARDLLPGTTWHVEGGDVVSGAAELVRLTLNVAMVHADSGAARGQRRLVYGGHSIGIAAAQAARALPGLVSFVGWHRCDHLNPVFEGDTLYSRVQLEAMEPLGRHGAILHLRSVVEACRAEGERVRVLDWRCAAVAV